jgi:hypothetical protein
LRSGAEAAGVSGSRTRNGAIGRRGGTGALPGDPATAPSAARFVALAAGLPARQGVEPLLNEFVPISIGAPQQPVVELTSGD